MSSYPEIWNLPFYNDDFIGRDIQIKEIKNILEGKKKQASKVIISGLPGIGKTQLAKRFAYFNKEKYGIVWWLNAESNLEESYLQLAVRLNILTQERRFIDIRQDILSYLRTYERGWLFIFDNVELPEDLINYLPQQHTSAPGHIIITSRDDVIWSQSYQLKPFLISESKEYFNAVTGQVDESDAEILAERLGNFPLALAHAAAYIRIHDKTYKEYLQIYENHYSDLLNREKQVNASTYTDYYHQTVYTSFKLLLSKIQEHSQAMQLLILCSFVHADKIPKFLLEHYLKNKNINFDDAYKPLRKYMILQRDRSIVDGAEGKYFYNDSYSLHRLIQEFIANEISDAEKLTLINECLNLIKDCFISDPNDEQGWEKSSQLINHLDISLNWADKLHIINDSVQLLSFRAFNYCSHKDLLELVKKYFNSIRRFVEKLDINNQSFLRLYAEFLINWVLYYKAVRVHPNEFKQVIIKIDESFEKNYWEKLNDKCLIDDLKYQLACALLELGGFNFKSYSETNILDRSEQLLNVLLKNSNKENSKNEMDYLCRLGILNYIKKEYENALRYLLDAHQLHVKSNYKYPNMSYAYNGLGIITRDHDNPNRNTEDSKQYYLASLQEVERMPLLSKTNRYTAWAHYGLSYLYAEEYNIEKALHHHEKFRENINVIFKKWPESYMHDKENLEEYILKCHNDYALSKVDNYLSGNINPARLLFIVNEKNNAAYIKKGLIENRFSVDVVDSGDDGIHCAQNNTYALIIIDVTTPNLDGWAVIKKIRKAQKRIPIMVISSSEMVNGKIEALELGAYDYILKPYEFSQLLNRIHKLLESSYGQHQSSVLRISDLKIHSKDYKVFRNGKNIQLTKKEFLLLELLARHEGQVLSRTFITEQIWDMNFDSDTNFLDVMIKRLRQKIDSISSHKLIHTVRGVGYMINES